ACAMVLGQSLREKAPDLTAVVLDATRLRRGLRLVAALKRLGVPMVVVLNMMDRVRGQGRELDAEQLQAALGVPVVEATGIAAQGTQALRHLLDREDLWHQPPSEATVLQHDTDVVRADDLQAQAWLQAAGLDQPLSAHA